MTNSELFGELLSPNEAADALAVSAGTIRRWLRQGAIPAHKIGRQWRVDVDALTEFLIHMSSESKESNDSPAGFDGSQIHCPTCAASDLHDLGGEERREYRCPACAIVFSINRGPQEDEFQSSQPAAERATIDMETPAIYERSPKRQRWYARGFEDGQNNKEITDQFLVDLTMHQGTKITGAYQHGYTDGLTTPIESSVPDTPEVLNALQQAEQAIRKADPYDPVEWVIRLMEAFDDGPDDLQTLGMLRHVEQAIDDRIKTGKWYAM